MKLAIAILLVLLAVVGCGGSPKSPGCFITGMNVSPATATVNHVAAAPGNSQQFAAFETSAPDGCAFALSSLQTVTWTVSDTVNASISNTHDATYGVATCIHAAVAPITVTATTPPSNPVQVTAAAPLTCN
jgi:hypothetical protein